MTVDIKYIDVEPTKEDKELINKFISQLKKNYPLENDITILFQNNRTGKMTTGSRTDKHKLKILVKDRLNRDVMRTLAHEWSHEHQRTVLNRKKGKNIGGKNENEASSQASEEIKKFEKGNKKIEKVIYKPFTERIERIESLLQIESLEKQSLINEIKKISVDKLPYEYDSLEVFIDSETMKTHYNKHYKGYVDKLNKELEKISGKDLDLEQIISDISSFNTIVRNNGGGAFNHALFWKMMSPKKQKLDDPIKSKIEKTFGSFEKFKTEFEDAAKSRFGSGWVWLILTDKNRLKIVTTANQDNPLMDNQEERGYPLLGLDVWEHAYYLKYKNLRDKYVSNFWKVVNWGFVNDLYSTQSKLNN
jgi:Fe-Mn family superoxide dismutase